MRPNPAGSGSKSVVKKEWMMADDGRRGDEDERGPGAAHHVYVVMEVLFEKLNVLNYEEEVLTKHHMRSLSRWDDVTVTSPAASVQIYHSSIYIQDSPLMIQAGVVWGVMAIYKMLMNTHQATIHY